MATKQDKLLVSTVSRTGKFSSSIAKGCAYLTVTKGFNEKSAQVAIEVSHSTGVGPFRSWKEHDTALINITFEDGMIWSGTFEKLQKALAPEWVGKG